MTDKDKIIGVLDAFGVMDWRRYLDGHVVKTLQKPPRRLVFNDDGELLRVQRYSNTEWQVMGKSE